MLLLGTPRVTAEGEEECFKLGSSEEGLASKCRLGENPPHPLFCHTAQGLALWSESLNKKLKWCTVKILKILQNALDGGVLT